MQRKRLDIQALRAVAVLLVIANHFTGAPTGGYLGVDIFFVISGYLITLHLRREVDATGRLRLAQFWSRRAKRLLPAAIVVLIVTAVLTAIWIPITGKQAAYDQIGAAGVYGLNWILALSSLDYFAQGGALSPVTHYWSLSVEEQFYIVWPILVMAAIFIAWKRTARVRNIWLSTIFGLVFVGSLVWATFSAIDQPQAAYFQTTARAWEFAAGGLIAFLPQIFVRKRARLLPLVWASWVLIGYSAVTFTAFSGVPGIRTLIPVVATAVLLWIGDIDHAWAPTQITSFAPVQLIGDISYSLYLWHWPLIVVAPYIIGHELGWKWQLAILILTIVLSYLTKRYVEDKFRFATFWPLKRPRSVLVTTAAAMSALLLVTLGLAAQIEGAGNAAAASLFSQSLAPSSCFGAQAALSGAICPKSHELSDSVTLLGTRGGDKMTLSNGSQCQQVRGNPEIVSCSFGTPDGRQRSNYALVGDSHATMWAPALDAVSKTRGIRTRTFTNAACPATLDSTIVGARDYIPLHQSACKSWREEVVKKIAADPSIDTVVTSGRARSYTRTDGSPDDGSGYVTAWQLWLDAGKSVIVIDDLPAHSTSVLDCLALAYQTADPCTVPEPTGLSPFALAAVRIHSPNFHFVQYQNVLCAAGTCHSVVGGIPAYMDGDHLSAQFARSFGEDFLSNISAG